MVARRRLGITKGAVVRAKVKRLCQHDEYNENEHHSERAAPRLVLLHTRAWCGTANARVVVHVSVLEQPATTKSSQTAIRMKKAWHRATAVAVRAASYHPASNSHSFTDRILALNSYSYPVCSRPSRSGSGINPLLGEGSSILESDDSDEAEVAVIYTPGGALPDLKP